MEKRLFDYLHDQLRHQPLEEAFGCREKDHWRFYSTQEMVDLANRASLGMQAFGLKAGDRVATVVSVTTPEWVALDFAMLQIGVIQVPLYPTISPQEYRYILQESGAQICVVGDHALYQKVREASVVAPDHIFGFFDHPEVRSWKTLLADQDDPGALDPLRQLVQGSDVATIIYTSGTTGHPKGVVLTHTNIIFNVEAMRPLVPVRPGQTSLSFLPVSHVLERVVVYAYTAYGLRVAFGAPDRLAGEEGDLAQVRPHFFSAVPRLLEKVYERILQKGHELKGVKRTLFFWSLELASRWDFGYKPTGWKAFSWWIADRLVFARWREALGGRVCGIVTGASPCPVQVMRLFNAAGIPVREGYGLSEAAPALSFNRYEPGGALLGTVGPLLEGVEVQIQPGEGYRPGEGEILARSPGIMKGYFRQPDKTAEVLVDLQGTTWLATGDVGMWITAPGGRKFLKITDRKKELLKTSGGKYVAPAPIEARLMEDYLVEQAMVVGDNRKFVSALLVPNMEGLLEWCHRHEVRADDPKALFQHPKVQERFEKMIARINPAFSAHEQIKKIALVPGPWEASKPNGQEAELTPTLKLKRRVLLEKYRDVIEGLYA